MSSQEHYSALDRAIHRLAFLGPGVQMSAADIERTLFPAELNSAVSEKPLFITSLPRAGTTLLLEVLSGVAGFAAHSYRDMPFVLAPLLWDSLFGRFRAESGLVERAHGDGVRIGYDSPEAFDEVLWLAYWPEKYREDVISLWSGEEDSADFADAFATHMRRVVAVRGRSTGSITGRYLSKNNANVARLGALRTLIPDGRILIPFRDPLEQSKSLLRQHERFLDLHDRDPFARRYMADIGHLEFGALHRPIGFPGMDEVRETLDPLRLDYWVSYWTAAFDHVLRNPHGAIFLSYERLCCADDEALYRLADGLDTRREDLVTAARGRIQPARPHPPGSEPVNPDVLERASALHEKLLTLSFV